MKSKSILILIATLIVGFAIGFMTNSQLTKRRIQSFVKMGTSAGFKERLYRVIKPDDLQLVEIDPILEKYAEKIHQSVIESREEMKNINDKMVEELAPFLNDEQLERMKKAHERIGRGWNEHRQEGRRSQGKDKRGQGR